MAGVACVAATAAHASAPQPLAAEGTLAAGPINTIDARSITPTGVHTGLVLGNDAGTQRVILEPDLAVDEGGVVFGVVQASMVDEAGRSSLVAIPICGRLRLNETVHVKLGAASSTTTTSWTHALAVEGIAEVGPDDWTLSIHGRSRGRASGAALAQPTWQWQMTLASTAGWQANGAATLTFDAGTQAGFYASPGEWTPRTPDLTDWQGDAAMVVDNDDARSGGRSRLALTFADAEPGEFVLRAAQGTARVRQTGAVSTTAPQAAHAWSTRQFGPAAFDLLPRHIVFTTPGSSTRTILEWR